MESKGDEFYLSAEQADNNDTKRDYYTKAANQYLQLPESKNKAVKCHQNIADLHKEDNNMYLAARHYEKAGEICANFEILLAEKLFNDAVVLFKDDGKFSSAAKLYETLAKLYVSSDNIANAIRCNEQSHYYWNLSGSPSTAIASLLEAAKLLVTIEKYDKALEHFQNVNLYYSNKPIYKFKRQNLNFDITVLKIYIDKTSNSIMNREEYHERDYYTLFNIYEAIKSNDKVRFSQSLADCESIKVLDPWVKKLLINISDAM
jgi:tetratricopeptide (TPR) repeat protein